MSEDNWGPWIEHDGKGCHCVGQWVEVVKESGGITQLRAGYQFDGSEDVTGSSWHWAIIPRDPLGRRYDRVLRYRIRKPRGLAILQEIVAHPPRVGKPVGVPA